MNRPNKKKKFQNLEELYKHWESKYDEEEIVESLATLKQKINETREKQGGNKIFIERHDSLT